MRGASQLESRGSSVLVRPWGGLAARSGFPSRRLITPTRTGAHMTRTLVLEEDEFEALRILYNQEHDAFYRSGCMPAGLLLLTTYMANQDRDPGWSEQRVANLLER